jgi:hypothetical protein
MVGEVMMTKPIFLLAFLCLLLPQIQASVVVTKLDPPLAVGVPWYGNWNTAFQEMSFGSDEGTNLLLTWSGAEMDLAFNAPSQVFILRDGDPPGRTNVYGGLAALPLGTVIGSNVVSTADISNDAWIGGSVTDVPNSNVRYDSVGMVVTDETIGDPISVIGDVVGKEGIMAVEIYANGEAHYGYVHFDFRSENGWVPGTGFGGYILGWAYESEPGQPITAAPIAVPPLQFRFDVQPDGGNSIDINWTATPGAAYRVLSTTNLARPFASYSSDIVPTSGADASPVGVTFTLNAPTNAATFWRVVRTH